MENARIWWNVLRGAFLALLKRTYRVPSRSLYVDCTRGASAHPRIPRLGPVRIHETAPGPLLMHTQPQIQGARLYATQPAAARNFLRLLFFSLSCFKLAFLRPLCFYVGSLLFPPIQVGGVFFFSFTSQPAIAQQLTYRTTQQSNEAARHNRRVACKRQRRNSRFYSAKLLPCNLYTLFWRWRWNKRTK